MFPHGGDDTNFVGGCLQSIVSIAAVLGEIVPVWLLVVLVLWMDGDGCHGGKGVVVVVGGSINMEEIDGQAGFL